jgi:hypothetical protein
MDRKMITVILLSALSGGLLTGGVMWTIEKRNAAQNSNTEAILKAIGDLESDFEKAQAKAVVNLTEPDLLKVPCSAEYIEKHGDLLCREMFCRMNRQGGGQGSSGGSGAIESDCAAISAVAINSVKVSACMPMWEEGAGSDQNSKYWRCMTTFGAKP